MWIHRMVGSGLALAGLALLLWLFALIYDVVPHAEAIRLALGIPLALIGALFGLLGLMVGCWLALAPGHAVQSTGRWLGGSPPER